MKQQGRGKVQTLLVGEGNLLDHIVGKQRSHMTPTEHLSGTTPGSGGTFELLFVSHEMIKMFTIKTMKRKSKNKCTKEQIMPRGTSADMLAVAGMETINFFRQLSGCWSKAS